MCIYIHKYEVFFQVLDTWFTILADSWWLSGYVLLAHSKFKLIEPKHSLKLNSLLPSATNQEHAGSNYHSSAAMW